MRQTGSWRRRNSPPSAAGGRSREFQHRGQRSAGSAVISAEKKGEKSAWLEDLDEKERKEEQDRVMLSPRCLTGGGLRRGSAKVVRRFNLAD